VEPDLKGMRWGWQHADALLEKGFMEITNENDWEKGERRFYRVKKGTSPDEPQPKTARVTVKSDGSWKGVGEDEKNRWGLDLESLEMYLDWGEYLVH
jgi:hypothetical protein